MAIFPALQKLTHMCVFFVLIVSLLKRRRWWCSPPQSAQPLRKPLADEEELMRASGFIYFICSIVHLYLYLYLFFVFVFEKKTLAERDLTRVGLFTSFAQLG